LKRCFTPIPSSSFFLCLDVERKKCNRKLAKRQPAQKQSEVDSLKIFNEDVGNAKRTGYNVGTWVIVSYEHFCYPGKILRVVNQQYEVTVMHSVYHKGKKVWRWPDNKKADIFL
jgi:hypothetical protein